MDRYFPDHNPTFMGYHPRGASNLVRLAISVVIFLTIPPIPLLGKTVNTKIKNANDFMCKWPQDAALQVWPMHEAPSTEAEEPNGILFNRFYGKSKKVDRIRLNEMGLEVMREFLVACLNETG